MKRFRHLAKLAIAASVFMVMLPATAALATSVTATVNVHATNAASAQPGKQTTLRGTFQADPELEGGCAWIEAGKKTGRYELVPPPGYRIDYNRLAIIGPDGKVVAKAGQTVTVTGSVDRDTVSTCQIGPIFRATKITPG
jgi:hypothetical protein